LLSVSWKIGRFRDAATHGSGDVDECLRLWRHAEDLCAVLFKGDADELLRVNAAVAAPDGPLVLVQAASVSGLLSGTEGYSVDSLVHEVSISANTAAAGGNASLMTIG
jgi:RHH-type proline utilization regulon transcriptional repressor/proline dehydrogenase/delta 1-pyrroline-5-carboxylate dehydrogenase